MTIPKLHTSTATGIAVLFHVIGVAGIMLRGASFANSTPMHLSLMLLLLLITQPVKNRAFSIALALVFTGGFIIEWIGVHTGVLFGNYSYGNTLGFKIDGIPLLIGANWVIVVAGTTSFVQGMLLQKGDLPTIDHQLSVRSRHMSPTRRQLLIAFLSSIIAVAFDYLLEPIAVKLGYWSWQDGVIPVWNYICWGIFSFLFSFIWLRLRVTPNQFGINLLLVQVVFFMVLRLLL